MRKIVMTLLCLIAVISGRAQESEKGTWTLTPKVGLNWAKMTNGDIWYENDKKASTKGKVGIVIGAEAEYRLLSGLGISAGLLYSQQGTCYEDVPNVWEDMKVSLDYLNLPLMAHLYIAPGLSVEAGVQPGYLIHRNSSLEDYHRKFDFGIPVGIAYDFDRLRLELRYCIGLYDTTKYDLKEHSRTAQLTVGYRFNL